MGLDFELPGEEHKETPVDEEQDPNRVDFVEIHGPNGLVTTFVFKGNWNYSDNEVDIQGVDPDGKAIYTAGLGGAFFALVKER